MKKLITNKLFNNMNYHQKLCIKSLTGNITETERIALEEWINSSETNQSEFTHMSDVWYKAEIKEQSMPIEIDNDWEEIQSKISAFEIGRSNQQNTRKFNLPKQFGNLEKSWKPVLIVSILILISAVVLFTIRIDRSDELSSISTFDEKKELVLSDNSIVLLNKNSSIDFPKKFEGNERKIKFKGEAYFTIMKDIKPFIIETENAFVTIKGTELNVISRSNITEVFVKEGKVDLITSNNSKNKVELKSGQLSAVEGKNKPSLPVQSDAKIILSWIKDEFIFESKPLGEIVEELNSFYNINIDLDEKLRDEEITGTFRTENPDSIITMICLTLTAEYEKTPYGYTIKKINR